MKIQLILENHQCIFEIFLGSTAEVGVRYDMHPSTTCPEKIEGLNSVKVAKKKCNTSLKCYGYVDYGNGEGGICDGITQLDPPTNIEPNSVTTLFLKA